MVGKKAGLSVVGLAVTGELDGFTTSLPVSLNTPPTTDPYITSSQVAFAHRALAFSCKIFVKFTEGRFGEGIQESILHR